MSGESLNADEWPSGEHIHQALVAYHKALEAAQNAWNQIPHEDADRG